MKRALTISLCLALAGCGVNPPQPGKVGARKSLADWRPPAAPASWTVRGRAAVKVPDDSATLSVYWRQDQAHYRISLRAPLGAGGARLDGEPGRVVLTTSDGERRLAASPEGLLQQATGFDLPVRYLKWWIRGLPTPDLGGEVLLGDDHATPTGYDQDGWTVRYSDWKAVAGYRLPGRFSVKGEGVRLRFAVSHWQVSQ